MKSRKLALASERLLDLNDGELASVVGATHASCPTHGYTFEYCSVMTLPVNACLQTQAC